MKNTQLVKEPIVQRPMIFKFKRANRMGNPFDGIFKAVSPVVSRIDAPFVRSAVVSSVQNSVHNRISHIQVGRCHIYFCPQCP